MGCLTPNPIRRDRNLRLIAIPAEVADRTYHVYVIALSTEVARNRRFAGANRRRNPSLPCVYVGSTALPPEQRFEQHLNGYKANRFVRKYGLELVPKLFERYNPIETRKEAELTEQHLAERLRRQGYGVWYG